MNRRRFLTSAAALGVAGLARADAPKLETIDLFRAGDGGYARYHIPVVLVTSRGTVLAAAEARKTGGDWATIDILLRRSTDDGVTWGQPTRVADVPGPKAKNPLALAVKGVKADDVTYNNPVPIADRDGTVHLIFCLEYMRAFYQRSSDDGMTWSNPVEITATFERFRPKYDWKVLATGPGHGIQLATGRLLVPVWLSTGTGGNAHRPSVTATVYSDDGGRTWHAGDIAVPNTADWVNPNETVAVELSDGRVMLNVRNESKTHRRLVTTSPDGATNWSTPRFDDALREPICMASLLRLPGAKPRLLFVNPDNLGRADGKETPGRGRDRRNLTAKVSDDDGRTWAWSKVIDPGWSAYSDLAATKAGTVLCFYGRGTTSSSAGDRLTLVRIPRGWFNAP